MVSILFFAKLKEDTGLDCLELEAHIIPDISSLFLYLEKNHGLSLEEKVKDKKILVALNHEMKSLPFSLVDGDEVAFFPPVTGG